MFNSFFQILGIVLLLLLLGSLLYALKLIPWNKDNAPERKTPRAGNHYILALMLFLLIGATGKAQVFVLGGAGVSNKYFSAELQAGYRYQQSTLSIGYVALPEQNQPALFNIRAGYLIAERVHVYGGYVKVMYSADDKSRNSNSWQAGAQYLFCYYDRGSFYAGANYTGNKMLSAHIGMTFQLSKGID